MSGSRWRQVVTTGVGLAQDLARELEIIAHEIGANIADVGDEEDHPAPRQVARKSLGMFLPKCFRRVGSNMIAAHGTLRPTATPATPGTPATTA